VPWVGRPVARLVQGTTMLGTVLKEDESWVLLDRVFDLGGTTLDTAHVYGGGRCEQVVGRWCQARGVREQLVLIGKGAHHTAERQRVTPADITADLHESLERLQTGYIDLYLLHRDDPTVEVGPLVEVLSQHQKAGLIRAYGGSNWTAARIREANAYAQAEGLPPFVASSPNFSLAEQIDEPWSNTVTITGARGAADRQWYEQSQLPVFAWSSLAGGFFSGRYQPDQLDTYTTDSDKLCLRSYGSPDNFERLARATRLADKRGLSLAQVALAYVLNQPLNLFALVGPFSAAEFEADVAAAALKLSPAELAWLDLRTGER
jgi:aryl-alcohol dehydrogenase-like predicted oxidoreductase